MLKFHFKRITYCLIIVLFIASCAKGGNESKRNDLQSFYIIDYDVNLYSEKNSTEIKKKLTFFDPITVMSDEVTGNGRINVKLQDNTEGWVREKYTSFIPKDWRRLTSVDNYYCYTSSPKKIELYEEKDYYGQIYHYSNEDFFVSIGVVHMNGYDQVYQNNLNDTENEIKIGNDKKLNWNKEFIIGNHKINYVITTFHPDGGISESFNFVKLNEINQKKYYLAGIDYQSYEPAEKKILWRKILFSTLQSLK